MKSAVSVAGIFHPCTQSSPPREQNDTLALRKTNKTICGGLLSQPYQSDPTARSQCANSCTTAIFTKSPIFVEHAAASGRLHKDGGSKQAMRLIAYARKQRYPIYKTYTCFALRLRHCDPRIAIREWHPYSVFEAKPPLYIGFFVCSLTRQQNRPDPYIFSDILPQ